MTNGVGRLGVVLLIAGVTLGLLLAACGDSDQGLKVLENPRWSEHGPESGARAVFRESEVDFGQVPLNRWIEYRFTLRNAGDQLLTVLAPPAVEVLDGC